MIVIGAGKAAASMALAVEHAWPDRRHFEGLVICPYGSKLNTRQIEVIEASHPTPDGNGVAGARRILTLAQEAEESDFVLALISGGGSALMTLPCPDLGLTEYNKINDALLKSGANIQDINIVRKHLCAVKGGRLAASCQTCSACDLGHIRCGGRSMPVRHCLRTNGS